MTKQFIDFDDIPEEMDAEYMNDYAAGFNDCIAQIRLIRPADVRPIVFCKDCKYRGIDADGEYLCSGAMAYANTPDDSSVQWERGAANKEKIYDRIRTD